LLVRRATYSVGGTREDPNRWQFGRFLQHEFPELGLVDGIEWTERLATGDRFGVSVGAMPEAFPPLSSFEDYQTAVYYRYVADRDEHIAIGAAYQNTWHHSEQDRNLFLTTLDAHSGPDFSLHGAAWVDYYGPNDKVKADGFELTELDLQANWRSDPTLGFTAFGSSQRYPELLREEFATLSPDQLLHSHVERLGLSIWKLWTPRVRLTARADCWRDQNDQGTTFDAGGSWRDLLWDRGEISLDLFYSDGSYSSGPGLRVNASKNFDVLYASLGYETTSYDQKGFVGSQATLAQQALFGTLDFTLAQDWNLNIYGERRFGDQVDSYSVGLGLTTHF
jgi:hypothetical protein